MTEGIKIISDADIKIWFIDNIEPVEYKCAGFYTDEAYFGVMNKEMDLLYLFPHRTISKIEINFSYDKSSPTEKK